MTLLIGTLKDDKDYKIRISTPNKLFDEQNFINLKKEENTYILTYYSRTKEKIAKYEITCEEELLKTLPNAKNVLLHYNESEEVKKFIQDIEPLFKYMDKNDVKSMYIKKRA